ncbi:RHS repeat-associated core domain-containing protein [Luteolibacter pohnpeiensis]|uniref:RHS repeat-associated core domain-containing protein n=1 Tax=Luteolibacter pohnpeiensis TaxID=454153 RepID=A0A934SAR5_9BACT|nr:RHS repeat-associated core domain-containing protein [Luteolibacter pohnpeiensis]MBK1884429.1 RHS repeat-associated core domain-containing protein [Luteolibacter pohnpeiensis]
MRNIFVNQSAFFGCAALCLALTGSLIARPNVPGDEEVKDDPQPCKKSGDDSSSFEWYLNVGSVFYSAPEDMLSSFVYGVTSGQKLGSQPLSMDQIVNRYYGGGPLNRDGILLYIEVPSITSAVLDPSVLTCNTGSNMEILRDGDTIRQLVTEDTFTIVEDAAVGFRVKVYDISRKSSATAGGYYTLTGSGEPIYESIFTTDDGLAYTNTLQIVFIDHSGTSPRVEYKTYTTDAVVDTVIKKSYIGTWDAGSSTPSMGALVEETIATYTSRGSRPYDYTLVKETKRVDVTPSTTGSGVSYGSTLVTISKTLDQYEDMTIEVAGGDSRYKRLVKHIDGYDSQNAEPLETNYTWYDINSNPAIHGRIKTIIRPDKSWEYHQYSDSPTSSVATETLYEGWKGQTYSTGILSSAKKTVTSILSSGYTRTVSIAGQTISQEKKTFVSVPGGGKILKKENKIGSQWLAEQTEYYPQDDIVTRAGRPKWQQHTDGTFTLYEYNEIAGNLQITEQTGAGSQTAITSGTETVRVYNEWQEQISEEVSDIDSGLVLNSWTADTVDSVGRPTKITYNGNMDDYEEFEYICCGLGTHRNRDASVEIFIYDQFKRVVKFTYHHYDGDPLPITSNTSYQGLSISKYRGGLLISARTESINGNLVSTRSADADGDAVAETTTYSYSYPTAGGRIVTQSDPYGETKITENYTDGQLKSLTGTTIAPASYDYGVHNENGGGLYSMENLSTTEWKKSYFDSLGRVYKVELPTNSNFDAGVDMTKTYYPPSASAGSRGKSETTTDQDGVTLTIAYDSEGRIATQTQQIPASSARLTTYQYDVIDDGEIESIGVSRRTRISINGTLVRTNLLSGDGYRSKQAVIGRDTSRFEKTIATEGGNSTKILVNPDGTKVVSTTTGNRLESQTSKASDDSIISSVSYTYDILDRVQTSVDSRTGTTTYSNYTDAGQAMTITAPGSRVTEFVMDKLGRCIEIDAPDTVDSSGSTLSNVVYRSYYPTGRIEAKWGDQDYATYYLYDDQNRMTELRTYQSLSHGIKPESTTPGFAKTNWNYDLNRGLLLSKRDNADKGATYKYTAAGRLKSRTWERGVLTTYGYTHGLLTTKDYSDDTLDVSIIYDAFGRYEAIKQHDPVTEEERSKVEYVYDPATLAVDTETISYDLNQDGTFEFVRVLDRKALNSAGHEVGWELKTGATVENEVTYGYHTTSGRLETVEAGALGTFNYSYVDNSKSLIESITGSALYVSNHWETDRDVLESKENEVGTVMISKFTYSVNDLGQRTAVIAAGTAFTGTPSWDWGYNAKGEVVKADSSVPANDRCYEFDGIGNRLKSANSLTLPSSNNYTVNALNQYTAIGTLSPSYDDDGNAEDYPVPFATSSNASLTWDAENRLKTADGGTSSVTTFYSYDAQGRMIGHFNALAGGWTYYVYDGWNRIAEYNNSGAIAKTYAWGTDMSGSLQGAGGVGGLLAVCHEDEASDPVFYPTYDGNGNVSEYLNSSGTVEAHFEYDPFGNTVVNTDTAGKYRYRFSTKPQDSITGLYYYGYRWYDPVTGRWPSRDPIKESGGFNMYVMINNQPISQIDRLGLVSSTYSVPGVDYDDGKLSKPFQAAIMTVAVERDSQADCKTNDKCDGDKKVSVSVVLTIRLATNDLNQLFQMGAVPPDYKAGQPIPPDKDGSYGIYNDQFEFDALNLVLVNPSNPKMFSPYPSKNSFTASVKIGEISCCGGRLKGVAYIASGNKDFQMDAQDLAGITQYNVEYDYSITACNEEGSGKVEAKDAPASEGHHGPGNHLKPENKPYPNKKR